MPDSIFNYTDYKAYLKDRAGRGRSGFKSALAKAANCHTGFVSKVLLGDQHFNPEQATAIGQSLSLSEPEIHFLILLVSRARAGTNALREYYDKQIDKAQQDRMDFRARMAKAQPLSFEQQAQYYSYWYYAAIHVALTVPGIRTPAGLASIFRLPLKTISRVLEFLESTGLAVQTNGEYVVGPVGVHLDQSSPFISRHHSNWRSEALNNLNLGDKDDLHYSGAVSMSHADFEKLKEFWMVQLQDFMKRLEPSPEEAVCGIVLDFFKYRASK
jgi:uncharacterized protein (TIGR02147 family)